MRTGGKGETAPHPRRQAPWPLLPQSPPLQKDECVCCPEQGLSQLVDGSHSQWISIRNGSMKVSVFGLSFMGRLRWQLTGFRDAGFLVGKVCPGPTGEVQH